MLSALKELFSRENLDPVVATLGYLLLGAFLGGLSAPMLPRRLLRPGPFPGVSLFLSPLVTGAALECWGRYRRRAGHATTNLATWYGGAALALGAALARFLLVL